LIAKQKPDCHIQVDGGVKVGNIAAITASGADMLVVGSAVYNETASVAENIVALREALG